MSIFKQALDKLRGKTDKHSTYRSMHDTGFQFLTTNGGITFADGTTLGGTTKVDERENKKPVEVWEMLKSENAPVVDTSDLDQKIKIIEQRIAVLRDHVGHLSDLKEEHEVLGYLQARKKYDQYKDLFSYPTTTDEMVRDLCRKYKLKVSSVSQYSGTMPAEAIDELHKFKVACKKIRPDNPLVRLIVPDNEPLVEKKKRDPILLVSSPFGRWEYILGAWDKEVLIVDEIIYMGK